MPLLLRRRPLLRAAVVGGGAYAVGRAGGRRAEQQAQADAEQQAAVPRQPSGTAGEPAPAKTGQSALMDQLNQLTSLHQQGTLTDEEFAAAKAKLLGGG